MRGVPNKATIVKQMVKEALASPEGKEAMAGALQELTKPPREQKKALDMLRELAVMSRTLVALYQPVKNADESWTVKDPEKLLGFLSISVRALSELTSFESPKFKAVAVAEVPPLPAAPPGSEASNVASSIRKRSQKDAMAVYMRVVRGAKAG